MFSRISWALFFETLLFTMSIYYVLVILIFYRDKMSKVFTEGISLKIFSAKTGVIPGFIQTADVTPQMSQENKSAILFSAVHDLNEDLKILFADATKRKPVKEELIVALQLALKRYPTLKETAFQVAINNQLAQQLQMHCNLELEPGEIKMLWIE